MKQHDYPKAETELLRASTLAPQDPDIDFMLGQLYYEMNQPAKAEAALRRSIELTRDPARNNYQVQRAHYLLARVLMQSGKVEDARQQIQISNGLLQQMDQAKQGESAGPAHGEAPARLPSNNRTRPAVIDAQQLQQAKAIEAKLAQPSLIPITTLESFRRFRRITNRPRLIFRTQGNGHRIWKDWT